MATQAVAGRRVRMGGSKFELYMWFFTRVSGILLLMMAAFNIVYANLAGGYGVLDAGAQMRWAFFPISFHVQSTKVEVTPNFYNPFWQAYTFLMIAFAATHGLNGIRVILQDYIRHPLLMAWIKALLVVLWVVSMVAASFVIFVFQG
jgi:succinate dehydrogenase / fumarate reductase, membrane anchor subunit